MLRSSTGMAKAFDGGVCGCAAGAGDGTLTAPSLGGALAADFDLRRRSNGRAGIVDRHDGSRTRRIVLRAGCGADERERKSREESGAHASSVPVGTARAV